MTIVFVEPPRLLIRHRPRTCWIAIATSHGRNRSGSRRLGSARTACSMVSCTTSSTSACPPIERPTMLYTNGRHRATRSSTAG
jgi:hypothetical protein